MRVKGRGEKIKLDFQKLSDILQEGGKIVLFVLRGGFFSLLFLCLYF
jgi:hypothetical protein